MEPFDFGHNPNIIEGEFIDKIRSLTRQARKAETKKDIDPILSGIQERASQGYSFYEVQMDDLPGYPSFNRPESPQWDRRGRIEDELRALGFECGRCQGVTFVKW